ncbi:hypothetical protein CPB83DRAFT_812785 [Crepidotus variabilis]|uniref:Uncharacterized protein n=1 Tax=Crepidotus variabilis TaxID=179855 RepID=A0A9P6EHJ3_9AGAR|nr:hypothetical protein CPB83DRAFT_812785 [Crepidotus variabilis]
MTDVGVDSDLFEDIYGEDANEFIEVPDEPEHLQAEALQQAFVPAPAAVGTELGSKAVIRPPASTDLPPSLPTKPTVNSVSNQSANTSYSAQVARQFSTYSQTSSQERLLNGSRTSTARMNYAIPTVDSSGVSASGDTVFGLKPSEMHDAG